MKLILTKVLLQKRKQVKNMNPDVIQKGKNSKEAKKNDLYELLKKHFRDSWREEEFTVLQNIIDSNEESSVLDEKN